MGPTRLKYDDMPHIQAAMDPTYKESELWVDLIRWDMLVVRQRADRGHLLTIQMGFRGQHSPLCYLIST